MFCLSLVEIASGQSVEPGSGNSGSDSGDAYEEDDDDDDDEDDQDNENDEDQTEDNRGNGYRPLDELDGQGDILMEMTT